MNKLLNKIGYRLLLIYNGEEWECLRNNYGGPRPNLIWQKVLSYKGNLYFNLFQLRN